MMDLGKYKWLDHQVKIEEDALQYEKEIESFLNMLDEKDYLPGKKNILACYLIDQLSKGNKTDKKLMNLSQKDFNTWYKSASFKKLQEKILKEDQDKAIVSTIISMMMVTLSLLFVNAFIRQNFLVTQWFDSLVGCVATVLCIRNIGARYSVIKRYTKSKDILYLDACTIVLCILLKFILPSVIDVTLVILFVDFYITKKKFNKEMDLFKENFK